MQFEVTNDFLLKLREAIVARNGEFVVSQLHDLYPPDIAEIFNELDIEEAKYVYTQLDEQVAADVLVELDEDVREDFLASLTSKEIAEHIDNMDSDDAADVISELPDDVQDEVLSHMEDSEQASDIVDLLNYDENTAGGLMATELVRVHVNSNAIECVREIREQADNVENIYAIYVVDDDEKLVGLLHLKKLIVSSTRSKVSDIYDAKVISVKTNTDAEECANIMDKYNLVVLPVVDEAGRLLGRITIDDVVDVMREEAEKDIQLMSGITDDVDSNDSLWRLSRARIPWLLIGMCGGIVGSRIIGSYEEHIQIHPEMAFFIPLIGATGGNVGVQSSSIIVQGLANNTLITDRIAPKLFKELGVGLINGLICSGLILGYNLLINESWTLAATVSIALFTVVICASFLGTFVPLMMDRFKINPALATGPFVTTLNDIIGISIYFLVGRLLYSFF